MLHAGNCSRAVHRLPAGKSARQGFNLGRALRQFRHADRRMGHEDAAPQALAGACGGSSGERRHHPAGAARGLQLRAPASADGRLHRCRRGRRMLYPWRTPGRGDAETERIQENAGG